MNRGDVVAVDAVLGLQLPVAADHVGRRAGHHLQPVLRLVGQKIDPAGGGAEMVFERRHFARQAAEDEPLVGVERADPAQIEALAREPGVGKTPFLVLDPDAAPAEIVGPAVEAAGERPRVAPLERGQQRAAMRARVDEAAERAVLLAHDEDRLAADFGGEVIARVLDLPLVAEEHPSALEDALDLGLEHGLVGVDRPVDPEHPLVDPVVDQIAETAPGGPVHRVPRPLVPQIRRCEPSM